MERPAVAISRCRDYDQEEVGRAVDATLKHLGGIESFVRPGERVLLKVNLLFPSSPDRAVTSHPAVVRTLVRQIEAAGGSVLVGDSPGLGFTRARLEKAYRKCGMYEAIEGTGAELNWDTGTMRVSNPGGRMLKSLELVRMLDRVDRVITVPKLKTHTFTTFTGGTKILYGLVPGLTKAAYHSKLPDPADFSQMLLDIQEYVKPDLTFMDAVIGMEGNGPSGGEPRHVGALLASRDPVALDTVAASMVGIKPMQVPTIRNAVDRGLATGKASDVDIRGCRLEDFAGIRFRMPESRRLRIPGFIMRFIGNRYTRRPVPDPERCVGCGVCVQACPRQCIRLVRQKAVISPKHCIRCYCCHEMCPEKAIDLV